jgi:hypothetical protein
MKSVEVLEIETGPKPSGQERNPVNGRHQEKREKTE